MKRDIRYLIVAVFAILCALSVFFALRLKFSFHLDQYFPEGDEDLAFFQEFIKEFETDVNFLLVAVERKEGVFDRQFLGQFHDFTLQTRDLPRVVESQSLTKFSYPLKTPFGITTIPAIHIDKPERYARDKARILSDPRFVNQLISADATSLVVALKTDGLVELEGSRALIQSLEELLANYDFEDYHLLGPAYFQKEMVALQQREIAVSTLISGLLVSLVMFLIFRKPWGVAISLVSIAIGMLLFLGLLGAWGRPLNAMAALYPVLMVIVGTSDVIHIMSKYIDELRKGLNRKEAIKVTIKEIGLATLLTSMTTAIGFASLLTSRITPIRDFGLNAAIGVLIAYFTVIFFTTAVLSWFDKEQLIRQGRGIIFWHRLMSWFYNYTGMRARRVVAATAVVLALAFLGISQITTNYKIESNLPRGKKISRDFLYFEEAFAGFRPMELAVFIKNGYQATDFEVLQQIDKVEQHLEAQDPIRSVQSVTAVYKSLHQMYHGNRPEAYRFPEEESEYRRYQRYVEKVPKMNSGIFVSSDGEKARISTRLLDVGADSIKALGASLDKWIAKNTDPSVATFRRTGTGLILDKNSEYVRDSLLKGLGLAMLVVSFLMALLFQNFRMVLVSLLPNLMPLLLAGALLGFVGIELEAGISIVFAVVFGIAVDDTIHFLSKFKLAMNKGLDREQSLKVTFLETGKAISLTTIILFFGFLVLFFSIHPPSVTIGLLIALTLFSALLADLFLIPVLVRWLIR